MASGTAPGLESGPESILAPVSECVGDCNRLRVVFAGTPGFAAVALQALIDSPHLVVGVLTQPDRPAGRGRQPTASAVKQLAVQHGLPVQQPQRLRGDQKALADLAGLQPEVLVVAAYGLILPAEVLSLPPLGCLNIHGSLLPRWRGAAPVQRAILAGDTQTGVCVMQMDSGLDTGAVLLEQRVSIGPDMTGGELHDRLAILGAAALIEALPAHCRGELAPVAQPDAGVTYAHKLNKAEAPLDWHQPATHLACQVRAFNPWPVAETRLDGQQLRVWQARVLEAGVVGIAPDIAPGTVIGVEGEALRVATGQGVLCLLELQRAGRKRVVAADFARGQNLVGQVLGA